jgi:mannose-6-phosphate isomerase-like protein (cupin superfamily)
MDTVHLTRANEGDHWLVVTDVTTVKASGEGTSGEGTSNKLLVLEVTVAPGGGPPVLHRHEYSEVFLFQEGEFEISTVDENYAESKIRVGAGDTVSVPSMVWHNFKNIGEAPGRFIAVHSPAVMEEFMREIGRRIDDPDNPPAPDGPPSELEVQEMMEIIGRYMEMLPPAKIEK